MPETKVPEASSTVVRHANAAEIADGDGACGHRRRGGDVMFLNRRNKMQQS